MKNTDKLAQGISRRDFIKGAAAGAVGLAAAGMLGGCASDNDAKTPEASSAPANNDVLTADTMAQKKWSFEIAPDPIPDSEIKETIEHDIIVIGSGMAGLCTMCSAMEQGADVLMFSAGSQPYSRGGSNHAVGSKYQKAKGIDYSPEIAREIVKTEQTSGTYFMDKKKWERWINNSAESVDWMIDKMEAKGLHVCLEPGYYDPDGVLTVPSASHNFWNEEQPFGALFGAPLQAQAYASHIADMGGEIHYKTVAKYLIRENDNTGRVSAVVAQKEDGSYVKYIGRKAIVLATGDFSRNKDMMAKYSPWAYEIFKDTLSDEIDYDAGLVYNGLMPGDGQKMGLWVGAAWQKTYPCAPMINGGVPGPSHAVISNFWGLNLDIRGQRFQNEVTNFAYGAMSVLQLPQRTAFGVWDVNYAYTQDQWEPFGHCVDEENGIKAYSPEEYIEMWNSNSNYFKADTLEELVDKMYEGYSDEVKANALASIKRYNEFAKAGKDDEFHVNPVCDADDQPIEGLYNTGIMVGDFYANSYNFVMPGQNLGAVCCTLSYLLGRELAEL